VNHFILIAFQWIGEGIGILMMMLLALSLFLKCIDVILNLFKIGPEFVAFVIASRKKKQFMKDFTKVEE
jgi:hypothetical protein